MVHFAWKLKYSNLSSNPSNDWRNTYPYTSAENIASQPGYPIGSIMQKDAMESCASMWDWYHLITNNEWMTIARNIEQQWVNWSSGVVWDGWIYNWITEEPTYWCGWNSGIDEEMAVSSTDNTCTKRVLTLSNEESIWDFAGNVMEHVNRWNDISATTASVWVSDLCWIQGYWYTNGDPYDTCWEDYGPTLSNANNEVDKIMWYVRIGSWTETVFARWGYAALTNRSGIYTLNVNYIVSTSKSLLGFRCAK